MMPETKENKTPFRVAPGTALLAVTAVAVIIASLVLAILHRQLQRGSVKIGDDITVAVDIAATPETRQKGLSGRESLGPSQGMLFVFATADTYSFWMKDMRFPIDILWIKGNELVDITTDLPVPKPDEKLPLFFPQYPADKALEVPAGFAKAHGLRTGMAVLTSVDKK